MSLWNKLFKESGGPAAEKPEAPAPTALVEDIVELLRRKAPSRPYCYAVLFGDRPLTGKMGGDESIMIFSNAEKANGFISGYQSYYHTTKPLSALAVGTANDLWSLVNNPAKDPLYKTPYGLIINFNYAGAAYNAYSIQQIKGFGKDGVKKGLGQVL
ncbi:MAG TPA: hypothetical protein VHP61_04660 [Acidobacteriota bacterium]|nr:hypothetical protein [Acidobacteriota bacterium]